MTHRGTCHVSLGCSLAWCNRRWPDQIHTPPAIGLWLRCRNLGNQTLSDPPTLGKCRNREMRNDDNIRNIIFPTVFHAISHSIFTTTLKVLLPPFYRCGNRGTRLAENCGKLTCTQGRTPPATQTVSLHFPPRASPQEAQGS